MEWIVRDTYDNPADLLNELTQEGWKIFAVNTVCTRDGCITHFVIAKR